MTQPNRGTALPAIRTMLEHCRQGRGTEWNQMLPRLLELVEEEGLPAERPLQEANRHMCFEVLANAMETCLDESSGTLAAREHTWNVLKRTLETINEHYALGGSMEGRLPRPFEEELSAKVLKALHNGVTKEELCEQLDLRPRSVQDLVSRMNEGTKSRNPVRFGGHIVQVKIAHKRLREKDGLQWQYKTANTVHPVALQMNVYQTKQLLESLSLSFYKNEYETSLQLAADIWFQLSDYCRQRIREQFAHLQELMDFLNVVEEECSDGRRLGFAEERELMEGGNISSAEMLDMAFKGGVLCDIKLKQNGREQTYLACRIKINHSGQYRAYPQADKNEVLKNYICFKRAEITEVHPVAHR